MFGGCDGCESGDRGCVWCGSVGVVEAVCGVRMGVTVGCVGTRGEGVVSSGRSVSLADGGVATWKDCCRFPGGISGELQEDPPPPPPLPYCLPFRFNIGDVFL